MFRFITFICTVFLFVSIYASDSYSKSMIIITTDTIVENSEKLNEYESDDENSNHSEQFHNFYSLQSQTTSIVEENMNLEYTFSMLEK